MLEFTPMDFFAVSKPAADPADLVPEVDLVKHENEESGTTLFGEDSPLSHSSTTTSKKTISSSSSDNHNMVKQLVITIKQMVGKYIPEIGCNHTAKEIISEVWSVFESTRNPSKDILKAMFNKEVNLRQVEKVRLGSIVRDYGSYEFLNAMDDLRMDIVFRMRC